MLNEPICLCREIAQMAECFGTVLQSLDPRALSVLSVARTTADLQAVLAKLKAIVDRAGLDADPQAGLVAELVD